MKQHLRFFTLALLCAMCSVGWGATKNYTFNFSASEIPTGRTSFVLSKDEVPDTFIMSPKNMASGKMRWIFGMETDAPNPIHCRFTNSTWQIGNDDKNGEVRHVNTVTLKSLGYFSNVTKIVFNTLIFSTGGAGTVSLKIGGENCGTYEIPGLDAINLSESFSGQVEITINQPETKCQLSMKGITITTEDDVTACGLAFEKSAYSLEWDAVSFDAPRVSNPNNLSDISYISSNPAFVTVNETTGEVESLGNGGTATIYAFFNGNDSYQFGCASYTINMTSKALWTEDFTSGN